MANTIKQLKIKLIKSPIGFSGKQMKTVKALGLTKLNKEVVRPNNKAICGMLNKIIHLVQITEA
jgi:large subunit ribosomal protein L30